ncbi:DUF4230 domain-containing protein [Clostridium frigidicarnis]|uniref:DUF4230 domain-containing protein n=1 Tax=Clostridium frigidicarnis TaxID=84698 RepID=A0A1I1B7M8_9CLOT|nr:DUF4230 domain-containing protein [Clostridium frigidicarnis]SFB46261.1 Protein of unknown function [Clostridium frigidicarnis]
MRKKLKSKLIVLTLLALVFIFLGGYMTYTLSNLGKTKETWIVPNSSKTYNKFVTKDILINEIKKQNELIPMETELKEEVTVNNSFGTLNIFKKLQTIDFFGQGIYTVDLSNLKSDKISIDKISKKITLTIDKPAIKTISIDEEKTIYHSPDLGVLRFGEVNLSPEEYDVLMTEVKAKMKSKLLYEDVYDDALKNSESTIKDLLSSILSSTNLSNYDLDINFV